MLEYGKKGWNLWLQISQEFPSKRSLPYFCAVPWDGVFMRAEAVE